MCAFHGGAWQLCHTTHASDMYEKGHTCTDPPHMGDPCSYVRAPSLMCQLDDGGCGTQACNNLNEGEEDNGKKEQGEENKYGNKRVKATGENES